MINETKVFLCSFSGSLAELPKKYRSNLKAVLTLLKKDGRFSIWDATEHPSLARSLTRLKEIGLIEYAQPQPEFPWQQATVTKAGEDYLSGVGKHGNGNTSTAPGLYKGFQFKRESRAKSGV